MSNNYAQCGGAIFATESTIIVYGETRVANNTAVNNGGGGGISLHQSELDIKGYCRVSHNHTTRGGGIHATSSTIMVHQSGILIFAKNRAKNGSGLYLEVNPKLYLAKMDPSSVRLRHLLIFNDNYAKYGGAVYVLNGQGTLSSMPSLPHTMLHTTASIATGQAYY